jgi:hypothetical protein
MGAAFGVAATGAEIGPAMSLYQGATAVKGEMIDEH